ncbi:MAG: acyltransferase family protein, partial [Bacilli bacterium]|nr:acyltransferase family protein [Bacilli bacterium]
GNGNMIPGPIKYLIFSLIGTGPLWYAHVLFIASLLIVLIRKIDKKQRIDNLFNKINLPILFLLFLVVWGSSFILNTPVVTVYRWGIYLLMFILGYYVFSNDKIIENLEKISIPLGIITVIFGIVFTIKNYGVNFGSNEFLTSIFTNVYIWLVILSAFGISKKYLDIKNKFTDYMNKNNFSFYVLHYTIQIVISFILVEYIKFDNFIFNYIILILGTIIILPLMTEILKRIPIVNRLLLGIVKK